MRTPAHCADVLRTPAHCADVLRTPAHCADVLRTPAQALKLLWKYCLPRANYDFLNMPFKSKSRDTNDT